MFLRLKFRIGRPEGTIVGLNKTFFVDAIGFALDGVGKSSNNRKSKPQENYSEDNCAKNVHINNSPTFFMNMKIIRL